MLTAFCAAVLYSKYLKIYTVRHILINCIQYKRHWDWVCYLEKNFYSEYGREGIISVAQDLIKSHRPRVFRCQEETESKTQTDVDMMSL